MSFKDMEDATVVRSEIVSYMGNTIDAARELSMSIKDDASANIATDLGVAVKSKLSWLKQKREEIYTPLYDATERVRLEFDSPIKLGISIEKTLAAAVIKYRLDRKREEERLRLAAEAEARRIREEADRKERAAEEERERIIKEQKAREHKARDDAAAMEIRRLAEVEAKKKAEQERCRIEQEERSRLAKEEEDARLAKAQEAHDVGITERVDSILERPTAIAPIAAILPSSISIQEEIERNRRQKEDDAEYERKRKSVEEEENRKREEEAAIMKRLQEDADRAKANADAAESMAAAQLVIGSADTRMRTSGRWKYSVDNEECFRKLVKAASENRVPIEWLNFDPENPSKFRATKIGKYVTGLRNNPDASSKQVELSSIGIRAWLEEGGGFIADKEII